MEFLKKKPGLFLMGALGGILAAILAVIRSARGTDAGGHIKRKIKGKTMEFLKKKPGLFLMGALGGILAAILAVMGNPGNMALCIACFIRDIAGGLKLHTAPVVQYIRPEIAGIVLGAFLLSLATREYRSQAGSSPAIRFALGAAMMTGALVFLGCPLRMVLRMAAGDLLATREYRSQAGSSPAIRFALGAAMMTGALVFLGCPLRMVLRMAAGDLNAYVALIGFVLGVGTGAMFLKKGFSLGRAYDTRPASGVILPAALAVLFVLSVTAAGLFAFSAEGPGSMHAPAGVALVCGLAFGALAQRSRMCFAGSVRDILLMKDFTLVCVIGGVFVSMLVYNIASGSFHASFDGQPVAHSEYLWNILGMYVVGFAAVLAGGCPLRQLILAGQGSSDAAMTCLGMFVGAAFVHNFKLASSAEGTTAGGRMVCLVWIGILFGSSDAAMTCLGMFVGAAFVHNFKLASSAEGTTAGGRMVCLVWIGILFAIAAACMRRAKK